MSYDDEDEDDDNVQWIFDCAYAFTGRRCRCQEFMTSDSIISEVQEKKCEPEHLNGNGEKKTSYTEFCRLLAVNPMTIHNIITLNGTTSRYGMQREKGTFSLAKQIDDVSFFFSILNKAARLVRIEQHNIDTAIAYFVNVFDT